MQLFLSIVTIFWLAYVLERTLFWVYLWQLKEYRIDRMKAHFDLASGKKLLFNRALGFKLLFALSSTLFFIDMFEPWRIGFIPLGSILYLSLGMHTGWKIWSKTVKIPSFTQKALLVTFLAASFAAVPPALLFAGPAIAHHWYIVLLLLLDAAVPLTASLAVGIVKPYTLFAKKKIMKEAARARASREGNLLVVGITGSYGKTTTKEFLAHILSTKFNVLKTDSHVNSEIAIARTILEDLTAEHEIFIAEMGAYRRGEIKRMCDMVRPHMGILTGVNAQHLALFGSQENIIKGKYELIESLPQKGLAVFNGDNKYCAILYYKTQIPKRMYSRSKPEADLLISDVRQSPGDLEFTATMKGGSRVTFRTPLIGKHYAENLAGAIVIAAELGMTPSDIQEGLATLEHFPHTMEPKKGPGGITIIDDSYSGNPDGVLSALDTLQDLPGRKIIVMPSLIELGKDAEEAHRSIARKIAKVCKAAILTTPDFFGLMQEIAIQGGMTEIDFVHMTDPGKIVDKIRSTAREGDIVLLESRVPKQLIEMLTV